MNDKVIVTPLPLFHIFAGVLTCLAGLISNTKIVFSSHKYDLNALLSSIQDNNCNIITCTPTIIIDIMTHIAENKIDLPLKIIQSGGAPLLPEIIERTFNVCPKLEEIRTGYGSTENGAVATLQTLHEPAECRVLSVGPPIDFTEVRIVKPNTDSIVPIGESGEIQTRGFNTMIEYLDQPDKTSEVITKNRWYRTGDLGTMFPHGSIQITGRLKEMIIKGGENIYPKEVEQLILKLDFVEQVHVIGVPDKRFGEQVCAWIKLKPGYEESKKPNQGGKFVHKDEVIEFCKKNITYFKVPKYILFVDDFPMTATKKAQHHVMTAKSIELLNLHDEV